ncbi:MAG TPA: hypothetical protein VFZ08_04040 [Terriglobia bacterium]|nr:hypothetical protein [Terriglobia bacterium]
MNRARLRFTSLGAWRAVALLCVLSLSAAWAYAGSSQVKQEIDWHAMGSTPCIWSAPVVGAHGGIDVAATIRILKENGLSCYGALIWRQREHGTKPFDWASFKKFVAAAKPAGINVWAILIPPSEGGDSPPFNRDYVRWVRELAKLSLKYPNLKGVSIDDFFWDYKFFTPAYTRQIYSAKQKVNPRFQFLPTIYGLDRDFAQRYGNCIDGVWLFWRDLEGAVALDIWIKDSRLAAKNRFPIYGGIYGGAPHWHKQGANPSIFRTTIETTCKYANGAVIWQMPLTKNPNPLLDVARSFGVGGSRKLANHCGTDAPRGSIDP